MSAWVVSKHHIDLLGSAAIDHGIAVRFLNVGITEKATEANAQAIGLMLWNENVRSVVYRYTLSGTQEERDYLRDVEAYSFRHYAGIRPSAAAAAASCYEYQSCECDDYRDTPAAFFVGQLSAAVGGKPKDYEAEPWGFDSSEQVQSAQAGAA
jgi:hypothetical protein